ncbi:MAG: hypothetical protein LBQ27_06375 [Clostridiales bacterium]|jgi:hypothetical protein|nr:hypothetical protein [Clostridiales bacterium]
MKKIKYLITAALIMSLLGLTACKLVDKPTDDTEPDIVVEPLEYKDDYLIGFFAYIETDDGVMPSGADLPKSYSGKTVLYDGESVIRSDGTKGEPNNDAEFYGMLSDRNLMGGFWYPRQEEDYVSVGGVNHLNISSLNFNFYKSDSEYINGEISMAAEFYYTEEFYGSILYIVSIFMNPKTGEIYVDGQNGKSLDAYGTSTLTMGVELKASRTNFDGTKEEISFKSSFTVFSEKTDRLLRAKISEYDDEGGLLKTTDIGEDIKNNEEMRVSSDCAYIIIEETYLKDDDATEYKTRTLVNKSEYDNYHTFRFPLNNGFISQKSLKFIFDKADPEV